MKRRNQRARSLALAAAVVGASSLSARAAAYYWNGTSNWNNAANWAGNSSGTSGGAIPGSGDTAIFSTPNSTAAQTVYLNANQTINGLDILGNTALPGQGALTISSDPTNADGFTLAIGSGGITVGANTTAAVDTINAGLVLNASQTWSDANPAGGGLQIGGNITSNGAANLVTSGTFVFNNANATINVNGGLTIGGNTDFYNNLLNGFSGGVTINYTGNIGNTGVINSATAITVDTTVNWYDNGNSVTLSGPLGGAGTLSFQNAGTVTLTGSGNNTIGVGSATGNTVLLDKTSSSVNAVAGALTINGTVEVIGAGGNQIASGTTVTDNGTFDLHGNSVTFGVLTGTTAGVITNNGSSSSLMTFGGSSGNNTYSGVINDGTGGVAMIKAGAGTETLAGSNTYSGGTSVTGGTLVIGNGTSGYVAGAINLSSGTAVLFNEANGTTIPNTITGSGTTGGDESTGITNTFGNPIGGAGFAQVGAGTSFLTASNSYAGSTSISAGGLFLSGSGTLGASTNPLSMSGGTLDLGGSSQSSGAVTISGAAVIQNGTLTGASYSDTANAPATGTISAILAGSGGLSKSGTATLILSGPNTYSGGTTLSGGVLDINNAKALGSGTLYLGASVAIDNTSGSPITLANSNPVVFNGGYDLTFGGSNQLTLGSLSYSSGITFTLNGSSQLAFGTLSNTNSGSGEGVTINGAGNTVTFAGYTMLGSTGGSGHTDTWSGSGNATITGPIVNGGTSGVAFTYSGTGILTLSGASSYSGTTTITDGVLAVNNTTGSGTGSGGVLIEGSSTSGKYGSLIGTGTISGNVSLTTSGATSYTGGPVLNPGGIGSAGTLTLQGGLTTQNYSSLNFDLSPTSTSSGDDLLHVNGAVSVGATTEINITAIGGGNKLATGTYDLINYTSLTGFGNFLLNTSGLTNTATYSLVNGVGQVDLKVSNAYTAHTIISLTAAGNIGTNYGNQITSGSGAGKGTFTGPGATSSDLTVTGNSNSYTVAQVTGISSGSGIATAYVAANGFSPTSDEEIYALDVLVGGQQPASLSQLTPLVNAIKGDSDVSASAVNSVADQWSSLAGVTAADPFSSSYDLFLEFSGSNVPGGSNDLGFDLSSTNDPNLTSNYTVVAVAVVPEPTALSLLTLAGLSLTARRRGNRSRR